MITSYIVENNFIINESTVLVLDKIPSIDDLMKKHIKFKNRELSYSNTHNDYMIVINGIYDLTGEKIEFC